jgi:metal-sulfur cluster biosynthetic enzyme
MMPTRQQVLDKINTVPEPCGLLMRAPLSVVEMGLVDSIRIDGGKVSIELVLTDASCVHWSSLRRYITDAVSDLGGVESVEVTPSSTKLWTPDRLQRSSNDMRNGGPGARLTPARGEEDIR